MRRIVSPSADPLDVLCTLAVAVLLASLFLGCARTRVHLRADGTVRMIEVETVARQAVVRGQGKREWCVDHRGMSGNMAASMVAGGATAGIEGVGVAALAGLVGQVVGDYEPSVCAPVQLEQR